MILFLDFDGVLHPSQAYMGRHGPDLAGEGSLFMWADLLAEELTDYPRVQIVLSTSWARHLPYIQVRGYLPPDLRDRVIGSTWHRIRTEPAYRDGFQFSYWQTASRYQQVRRWVDLYRVTQWLAIDDDTVEWADADRCHLVATDGQVGLSDVNVQRALRSKLEQFGGGILPCVSD